MANSGLSGLRAAPIDTLRLAQVDSLARFSVLYADTVFIQEPLSEKRYSKSAFPGGREELAIELAVMLALKPLLEAGIVKIASNDFPLNNLSIEEINREIQRIVNQANTVLRKRFGKDVVFYVSYKPRSGVRMTIAEGPLDLIEIPSENLINNPSENTGAVGRFALKTPSSLIQAKNTGADNRFTLKIPISLIQAVSKLDKDELINATVDNRHPAFRELFEELIQGIVQDLAFMGIGSLLFDLHYITDRNRVSDGLCK